MTDQPEEEKMTMTDLLEDITKIDLLEEDMTGTSIEKIDRKEDLKGTTREIIDKTIEIETINQDHQEHTNRRDRTTEVKGNL